MICIAGNMPVIQVGDYLVTDYDTEWIRRSLQAAVDQAEQTDFAFVDDIYEGIVHYLEHQCPLRLLQLEALYDRICHVIKRMGCKTIADALVIEAPAVTLSLETAAQEAGNGFELAFYQILQKEMKHLKKLGVNEIFFDQIRESILTLKQTTEWSDSCEQLEQDIMLWLKKEGTRPQRQGYRIRCQLSMSKV